MSWGKSKLRISNMHLSLYNWLSKDHNSSLYTPKGLLLPENSLSFLDKSGYPYIMIEDDEINAFSGIFNPTPLFYTVNARGSLIISDDIFTLLPHIPVLQIDRSALLEYKYFRNCLGNKTLVKSVKLLEAGEAIKISNGELKIQSCFLYYSDDKCADLELAKETFWHVLKDTFSDYVKGCQGNTIIVPLSCGYDSRLVISMLRILNFKDVIAVTYGVAGNYELPIAKKVAEKLGYEHIFIEYKDSDYTKLVKSLPSYLLTFSALFRTPNIQELISTIKLKRILCEERNLKSQEIVFMPGHTGDFLSGKQVLERSVTARKLTDLAHAILNSHHTVLFPPYPSTLVWNLRVHFSELFLEIKRVNPKGKILMVDLAEIFNWRERQFKFISTSMLPYVSYGFQYAVPLWDKRIVDFFSHLDIKLKIGQTFYVKFLKSMLFAPLGIDFHTPISQKPLIRFISDTLKQFNCYELTTKIKNFIFKSKPNPCGHDKYFPMIHEQMQGQKRTKFYQVKDPHGHITLATSELILNRLKDSKNIVGKIKTRA